MTAPIRVTVLVENTAAGPAVRGEHGLSFWVQTPDGCVLFDTGQTTDTLQTNAQKLGIDLASADALVLSHGHYDHTGGLAELLPKLRQPRLYLHPQAMIRRFSKAPNKPARDIGIPTAVTPELLQAHCSSIHWTTQPTQVLPNLYVTGPIPRTNPHEDTGGPFFLDPQAQQPDPITDDQALYMDSAQGLIVLLGCAHAGVVNTLRYIEQWVPNRPIHAVLGGMHLLVAQPSRMDFTLQALEQRHPQILAPCHCTGIRAIAQLWHRFPQQMQPCPVGSRFSFDFQA